MGLKILKKFNYEYLNLKKQIPNIIQGNKNIFYQFVQTLFF